MGRFQNWLIQWLNIVIKTPPPSPPSNFHQSAIFSVAYLRRLVGRCLQQFQASQQSPNIARGKWKVISPPWFSLLGVRSFDQKHSCKLPFMARWPELHCMHFLNYSLARGMGWLLDSPGLFLGLGLGSECPEAHGCMGGRLGTTRTEWDLC